MKTRSGKVHLLRFLGGLERGLERDKGAAAFSSNRRQVPSSRPASSSSAAPCAECCRSSRQDACEQPTSQVLPYMFRAAKRSGVSTNCIAAVCETCRSPSVTEPVAWSVADGRRGTEAPVRRQCVNEHTPRPARRAAVPQIGRQCLPNVFGQRQRPAPLPLAGQGHQARVPVEVVQRQGGHFAAAQTQPREREGQAPRKRIGARQGDGFGGASGRGTL